MKRTASLALSLFLIGCASTDTETQQAAVASAHPLATEAGLDVLEAGGNAYDAAVATAAVLGVVEPYAAGMGGGGFWVLQDGDGDALVVDARETAPGRATPDMYLDSDGEPLPDRPSLNGALAAGIPGQPAALAHITGEYGTLSLSDNLADAIHHAREGFPVDERYRMLAGFRGDVMRDYATTRELFLDDEGKPPEEGTLIHQQALAETMEMLAEQGHDGFYRGEVAEALLADVQQAGGIWTLDDLHDYELIERSPRLVEFGDATIVTAPAPSSGGIALAQMFGMLEHRAVPQDAERIERVHLLSEMMRRAYRDRALHLGDPDFTDIPVDRLLDSDYLAELATGIDAEAATPSSELTGPGTDGTHTTHLSVVDAEGNAVSATLSINYPFGSGVTSQQTGIVLNNEMDDFSIKPGEPNAWGLIGGEANRVEPGKRPLSSMSPSILNTPEGLTILGTPGGSRIITMNFLGLLDALDGTSPETTVARSRFHHQYEPDAIQHEPDTFSEDEKSQLRTLGHELEDVGREYGNMQLIQRQQTGETSAAADPRGIGSAEVRQLSE